MDAVVAKKRSVRRYLVAGMLVWLPILVHIFAPGATTRYLTSFNVWLRAHGKVILVCVLVVAIDIGGTFTDLIGFDEAKGAFVQAKSLTLTLGYSHLINFAIPEGITIETPSQTEIIIKGIDRQRVGQTAAEIRGFRPPEPYKGKGVKYSDEKISLKEAKKK